MKAYKESLAVTIGICAGFAITGVLFKQPSLIAGGAGAGLASAIMRLKQDELDEKKQDNFDQQILMFNTKFSSLKCQLEQVEIELKQENDSVKCQVEQAQTELKKQQKQIETQRTRLRLHHSAFGKVQYQQKKMLGTMAEQERRLSKVTQNHEAITLKYSDQTQNLNKTPATPLPQPRKPVTHIYIDGNNFKFALDKLQIEVDYNALRIELTQGAAKTQFKYYSGFHSPLTRGEQQFISVLENQLRYKVVQLPLLQREHGNRKTVGDDVQIAIDIRNEVKSGDFVILVSGDGDYIPVVKDAQARGVKVTVVAERSMFNSELRRIADSFILLDEIKYKIAKYRKLNAA